MSLQIINQVSIRLLNSLMVDLLQVLYTGLPTKHPNFFQVAYRFEADDDLLVKSNVSHTIALLKQNFAQ